MIRPASLTDARAIAELESRVWHRNWDHIATAETVRDADVLEAGWLEVLKDGAGQFVWVQEDRIAGVVSAVHAHGDDVGGGVAEIVVLMVDPPAQLSGIGVALHDHILDTLAEGRLDRVVAWVHEEDEAGTEFLADRGWEPDGEVDVVRAAPMLRMARDL
ncbi:MAG TPA: GNAT family N-acetyltransferase [Baekduia sp.]|nr:GNAT family N-acetyltransferase [Baekduia sp.]